MAWTSSRTVLGISLVTRPYWCFAIERRFSIASDRAWDILTDTVQWPRWGPTVRSVVCTDRYIREGARGRVYTPIGLSFPFVITEYSHGHCWSWRVAGIRATGHRVIRMGEGSCKIVFEMPVLWLPYVMVCRLALARMTKILAAESP